MPYELTILSSELSYRQLFEETYCNPESSIITFDNISVKFYKDKFEHAFYESINWRKGDKSLFSPERAKRILWIKDTLEDKTADLRMGWNKITKTYDSSTRVAIVAGMYVVIIRLRSLTEAVFKTAFWADNSITKILKSPKWKVQKKDAD